MTEPTVYDVIVVGAGVEGSGTAYQLSKRGANVLLLEQFPLPHTRGSSHGPTRITRKAYRESFYTRMMEYSTLEWARLQEAEDKVLFKKIGFLAIGTLEGQFVKSNVSSMETNGATYELLGASAFQSRYPMLRYGDGWGAVFDPEGGILMADRAVRAFQAQFVKHGGRLRDGEKVTAIRPGHVTQIETVEANYKCKAVVLCCGPWTSKLLKPLHLPLPLKPIRISVCYWPEKEPGSHSADKMPTFFEMTQSGREFYGLPSEEYPGHVKLCLHNGPAIDPEHREAPDAKWTVDIARDYVKEHFPGLAPEPSLVETCIYTMTPDEHFILDRHPVWSNVIIGAGFSGHGFKLAPAVGSILADLATNRTPKYDLSPFKMNRFAKQAKL